MAYLGKRRNPGDDEVNENSAKVPRVWMRADEAEKDVNLPSMGYGGLIDQWMRLNPSTPLNFQQRVMAAAALQEIRGYDSGRNMYQAQQGQNQPQIKYNPQMQPQMQAQIQTQQQMQAQQPISLPECSPPLLLDQQNQMNSRPQSPLAPIRSNPVGFGDLDSYLSALTSAPGGYSMQNIMPNRSNQPILAESDSDHINRMMNTKNSAVSLSNMIPPPPSPIIPPAPGLLSRDLSSPWFSNPVDMAPLMPCFPGRMDLQPNMASGSFNPGGLNEISDQSGLLLPVPSMQDMYRDGMKDLMDPINGMQQGMSGNMGSMVAMAKQAPMNRMCNAGNGQIVQNMNMNMNMSQNQNQNQNQSQNQNQGNCKGKGPVGSPYSSSSTVTDLPTTSANSASNGSTEECTPSAKRNTAPPVSQPKSTPTRTYTKVYKLGSIGRALDVTRFNNYTELRAELARMFGLEGQLDQKSGWQLVFIDHENDILLVGDDPWEEFVTSVRGIRILSPSEVAFYTNGDEKGSSSQQGCLQSTPANQYLG